MCIRGCFFLLFAFALIGADVYFGNKAQVTTLPGGTNYFVMTLGTGTNAPQRLFNPTNLPAFLLSQPNFTNIAATTQYVTIYVSNSISVATNTLASTNYAAILASNDVRVAAGANVTVSTTSSGGLQIYTVASTGAALEVQTNGTRLLLGVTNINFTGATGFVSGSTVTIGNTNSGGGSGSLSGTIGFKDLSVQAAKIVDSSAPVGFENGYQDWETVFYKTNVGGTIADISATWQFIVPPDYATNTIKIRIDSTLLSTNGPNTSNTIWGVSVVRASSGDSTDVHTASFSTVVTGTNTWTASGTGTNKMQSLLIDMGTSTTLGSNDLCLLKLTRKATQDTYGGATPIQALRMEYTR